MPSQSALFKTAHCWTLARERGNRPAKRDLEGEEEWRLRQLQENSLALGTALQLAAERMYMCLTMNKDGLSLDGSG